MTGSWPARTPGARPTAGRRTTPTRPISRRSRRVENASCRRPMSWFPGTTRRSRHGGTRTVADLSAFDALVDERFDGWVEELRDFCAIPSETDHFPELERGAGWVEERLRAAGADVTVLREEGVPLLVVGEMG